MMTVKIFLLLLIFVVVEVSGQVDKVGCLDHNGQVVDWYVVYTTNANTNFAFPNYGYLYYDNNS